MKNYKIVQIKEDELEQCAEVIRQGFGTVAKDFGLTTENCPTNGAFIKVERLVKDISRGNLMFGLIVDNSITGFMQLQQKSEILYELRKVTVLPKYRHFGYGKIMLDYAKKVVKEHGGTKITIGIIEENVELKEWYKENGFIHTGTTRFDHLPFTVGFMEMDINQ